jgi:D-alanyl-D-alanine dipeptidase
MTTRPPAPKSWLLRWVAGLVLAAVLASLPAPLAAQNPAALVDAAASVEGLVVDMRYAGSHNFVGEPIDGYERARCLLTRPAAAALATVARDLAPRQLALKVFDCYRPARAVAHFMRWAQDLADLRRKDEFYPAIDKRDLFRQGYIAERSGHSRGSTLDMTLVRRDVRPSDRWDELDMGTPFDLFDPKSWPSDPSVTAEQRANRKLLSDAMRRRGFKPYDREWWHFGLASEPFPDRYFDLPVR